MPGIHIRDKRTTNRFFVDNTIIRDYGAELGPYGIAVYCCLCVHADLEEQTCFPSQATIAGLIGCSRRKVHDAVLKLEALGLIQAERRQKDTGDYDSNVYTLLDPPTLRGTRGSASGALPSAQDAAPHAPDALGVVHDVHNNNPHSEQSPLDNDSGANAPDPPPPKRRKRPSSVDVFRENAHRFPARAWYATIGDIVGDDSANLERWGHTVFAWVGLGWNPTNVKGMLECYERNEMPGQNRATGPPGGDGHKTNVQLLQEIMEEASDGDP